MPRATLKHPNESFESLYKRFVRAVEKDGTLITLRNFEEYTKPSVKNRLKRERAKSREKRRYRESFLVKDKE